MTWIRVLFWLLPRRLRTSWPLLSVTSFGILTAVTMMAVGAVYSKALAEGGIRHTLALTSQVALNAQVMVQNRPLGPADYQRLRGSVEDLIGERLENMLRDTQRFGRSGLNLSLVMSADGRPPSTLAPWGQPFFLTDFEKHAKIVEGRWPQGAPVFDEKGVSMEIVVGRQAAATMAWEIGTQVYLIPFIVDPSQRVAFTLVGLVEPIDPAEEYWMTSGSYYFNVQEFDPRVLVPIYLPEDSFFGGLGARFPSLLGDYWWLLFIDTGVITADTAGPIKEAIVGLEKDLNKLVPRSVVFSLLEKTIAGYQRELTLAKASLFIFLSLVVAVILYFLVIVLGLLARTQSDAANILRSRGASMLQVSGLFALGEGGIVLLSMVMGPFLALGIVRYLLVGTITPAGDGGPLPVDLSASVFLIGAVGGLLSLAVLTASGVSLGRLGIVEFLRIRARPPTVPLLHRYYVDMLVLAIVSLLWWQIEDRGGFIQRELAGGALKEVDLSMLLGPVLILLAAAFLILRLLPLLMRALALAGRLVAPAWVSFTLTRMARDPLPHGSLIIILMMAAALGVFGATFQSTLSRSQEEQALYSIGGDLVVKASLFSDSVQEDLASMPGVQSVSPVVRISGTLLLGVDPDTLPDTAWFRDDFAGMDLSELLMPLTQEQEESPGIDLPEDAESIGIWLRVDETGQGLANRTLFLRVRVADSSGRFRSLSLGEIPSTRLSPGDDSGPEWTYLEALLPVGQETLEPPLSVVSIYISGPFVGSLGLQPGSISLDDIIVKGPFAPLDGIVVEDYEEPPRSRSWVTLPNVDSETDRLARTTDSARSGRFGLSFSWQDAVGIAPRGVLAPTGPLPLPAIGGPTYHVGQSVRVEIGNQLVPLVVRNVTNYFPSIIQTSRPFLLVNMEDYGHYIRRIPGFGGATPSEEFWVSLNDAFSNSSTVRSIMRRVPGVISVQDRDAAVELAQSNPLEGSSWTGLTILSMFAMTVAVAVILGTHSAVSVHADRVDLTVVGALGFSRLEIFLSLVLEKTVVAIVGIAIGSAVGIWLSQWVLGFLDETIGGTAVVPPMIFTIHGGLITLVYVSLVAALAIAVLVAVLSARRLRTPDILWSA